MSIFFKRRYNAELSQTERDKYISILNDLCQILHKAEQLGDGEYLNDGQRKYVEKLMTFLHKKDDASFGQSLNSVDMWGGSGAVWEVYVADKALEKQFYQTMIELIDYMEQTKMLGRGIKPIRKLFQKELNK